MGKMTEAELAAKIRFLTSTAPRWALVLAYLILWAAAGSRPR
jgi:hypothetical protein